VTLLTSLDQGHRRGALSSRKLFATIGLGLVSLAPIAMVQLTTGELRAATSAEDPAVLRVAQDGSADFTAIQEALDAAPLGATVQVAAGSYVEDLTITHDVQLQGAGWEDTRLMGTGNRRPALLITEGHDILIRGLRFSSPGEHVDGAVMKGAVVEIADAVVEIDQCAIAGGPASGVQIMGQSEVTLSQSLVAAVWAEGVVISDPASATLTQCEIRNAFHYGVAIRSQGDVTIERCRISGSAWHGIRYDHCSPTLRGNLLFDNTRLGIYANGETSAQVTANHFHGNGTGITCWNGASDSIHGNTFSNNLRSGVTINDSANPQVTDNIFFNNPVGVSTGNLTTESPFGHALDEVVFANNAFWKNGEDVRLPLGDALFSTHGNSRADPLFNDVAQLDFGLSATSPARQADMGAAEPLGFLSPWAVQAEEVRFISDREKRAALAAAPSPGTSQAQIQSWVNEVMQIDDEALREAGVAKIREAMGSADEATRVAALSAFLSTSTANYDKASFREVILPLTTSAHGTVQTKAFYALWAAGSQPGDLDLLIAAAHKNAPGLSDSISHLLFMYCEGKIAGPAADVLLDIFQTQDARELRELCRGLWGARITPELEARLIALAQTDDPNLYHDVIYFAISTSPEKPAAFVDALIKAAVHPDHNNSGRALWGLSYGVDEAQHGVVAEFALKLFKSRNNPSFRSKAMTLITAYAGPDQLQQIEELAANTMLSEDRRHELRAISERLTGEEAR